jgi:hypothetical protein
MIEDEAKAKWCPFGANRFVMSTDKEAPVSVYTNQVRCIGSDCMAWRFDKGKLMLRDKKTGIEAAALPGVPFSPVTHDFFNAVSTSGYCGLSGKP